MKQSCLILLTSLILITLFSTGVAQELQFHHYTMKDGLQANSITSLAQDSKGYLWIGTSEGISVFDGVSYKNYTVEEGLPGGIVRAILERRSTPGQMWIGTVNGICKYENGRFTSYRLGETNQENRVYYMIEDSRGFLWCATDNGVYLFKDGQSIPFMKTVINDWIYRIAEDNKHNIWIGGTEYLWHYDREKDSLHIISRVQSPKERITAIYPDSAGNVWVARLDSVVEQYVDTKYVRTIEHGYGYSRYILDDREGNLFIATTNGLLILRNDARDLETMEYIGSQNGLPDVDLTRLLFDREDNLWIAGNGKGLARLSDRNYYSLALNGAPIEFELSKIIVDNKGHYWISSNRGVWEFWITSKGKAKYYFHAIEGALPGIIVMPRAFDSKGNLWLSSSSGEVSSLTIQTFDEKPATIQKNTSFYCAFAPPKAREWARGFIIDSQDRAWYAVQNSGIYCVDITQKPHLVRKFTKQDGVMDSWARTIYEDREKNIWVGGFSRGLSRISFHERDTLISTYTIETGLPDGAVRGITQDASGRMWFGFRYAGLAVLENNVFHRYLLKDGLRSNAVWFLTTDKTNRVWIGTQTGLQWSASDDFPEFQPKDVVEGYRVFSAAIGAGGTIVIMTPDGIDWYNPDHQRINTTPPLVHINRFLVNNIDVDLDDNVEFSYDQRNMKFDFAGISFRSDHNIKYRYHLLPGEKDWLSPTSERSVTYRFLTPGTYTFRVQAISAEGIVSPQPAIFKFTILSPFWMSWWFQVSVIVCFAGVLYFLYHYRMMKALEMERLRIRLASDLHDEIASNLSSIAMYSKIIQDDSYRGQERLQLLDRISVLSNQSVDAIRDIIWAIDPRTETLSDLLVRVKDYIIPMCHARSIQVHCSLPPKEQLPSENLKPELRKNLWLLLKEATMNSLKHSGCTELSLICSYASRKLFIEIKDNGTGFDPSQKSKGKGLETMRMRCRIVNGTFSINSQPHHGTMIAIVIALSR